MKLAIALATSLIAASSLALTAHAAPPEGKGQGNSASHSGKGGNGGKGNPHASGNSGQGNSGSGNAGKGGSDMHGNRNQESYASQGKGSRSYDSGRRYDDQGRYYDYFDDHRDRDGHLRGDDLFGDLVYAGITAALAREYALDFGLGGYSSLPPGIRKNLARGKPLPPGIAKQMVPGSLLGRLPRYPGYEWRVAGTDLILISVASAVIADILYDVF
ncbi:anti-virulence regulator CigR family protein [Pollutimonas harenae]|uniref:Nickel/cobalt transporter regulator n=1 Tax=Pollutimonas harenae TaxID=657015 RepID=A0A853GZW3_9BURK|nr:anti-virulence regulator CigR family protein [Pollutimonas harenae]NYT84969.1 hypothetical protein [Pollutimonas harenae]TEA72642.1 hypothetical protein ERD84_01660 [Pollutimonas harenae]